MKKEEKKYILITVKSKFPKMIRSKKKTENVRNYQFTLYIEQDIKMNNILKFFNSAK